MSEERAAISGNFWKNITTIGAVVVGIYFIQGKFTDSVKEVVAPLIEQIKKAQSDIEEIKPKVEKNTLLVNNHEEMLKEYLKMEAEKRK